MPAEEDFEAEPMAAINAAAAAINAAAEAINAAAAAINAAAAEAEAQLSEKIPAYLQLQEMGQLSLPGGGLVPVQRPTGTIRDSAGAPLYEIETTPEEPDPEPWTVWREPGRGTKGSTAAEEAVHAALKKSISDLQETARDLARLIDAKGLEQFLAAAGRAVRGADGPGRVPVELDTLTYAATALEGSSDNGDRYAARQIREAISQHPSPEAYMATQLASERADRSGMGLTPAEYVERARLNYTEGLALSPGIDGRVPDEED